VVAEIGEVFRDFDLGRAKDGLKMADAQRAMHEEVKNAQARFIAETFVNFEQPHDGRYTYERISVKRHIGWPGRRISTTPPQVRSAGQCVRVCPLESGLFKNEDGVPLVRELLP
jgi:hypothetical protein